MNLTEDEEKMWNRFADRWGTDRRAAIDFTLAMGNGTSEDQEAVLRDGQLSEARRSTLRSELSQGSWPERLIPHQERLAKVANEASGKERSISHRYCRPCHLLFLTWEDFGTVGRETGEIFKSVHVEDPVFGCKSFSQAEEECQEWLRDHGLPYHLPLPTRADSQLPEQCPECGEKFGVAKR